MMPHLNIFFIWIGLIIFSVIFLLGGGRQRPMMAYYPQEKEKITFEKDIKPIMDTYCGGLFCHHGKPSTWTKYEFTKKAVDNGTFYNRVIEKKDMPKRKKLSEEDIETIKKWLKSGAPK